MDKEIVRLEGLVEITTTVSLEESLERLFTEPPPHERGPQHYKRGLATHPDVEASGWTDFY